MALKVKTTLHLKMLLGNHVCAEGYTYKEGDIGGWGFGGSQEDSSVDCANRCNNHSGCNSYQFSAGTTSGSNCAIHSGGEGDISGSAYGDFHMCFRGTQYQFCFRF